MYGGKLSEEIKYIFKIKYKECKYNKCGINS